MVLSEEAYGIKQTTVLLHPELNRVTEYIKRGGGNSRRL